MNPKSTPAPTFVAECRVAHKLSHFRPFVGKAQQVGTFKGQRAKIPASPADTMTA